MFVTETHICATHWSAWSPEICASASWLLVTADHSASTLTQQISGGWSTLVHIWAWWVSCSCSLPLSLSLLCSSLAHSISYLNSLRCIISLSIAFFLSPGFSSVPYQQTIFTVSLKYINYSSFSPSCFSLNPLLPLSLAPAHCHWHHT